MEQLILNLVPGGVSPVCYVSQYDVGRKIRLHLRNGSDPYVLSGAETVTATIRKVSGEELIYDIANTSASYVDMIVNYDATDVIGESVCELVITESGIRLGSANFKMRIDPDVYSGDQKLEVVSATSETPDLSFETNVEENLLELKAGFSPVQDLHGYDSPWIDSNVINKVPYIKRAVAGTATRIGNHLYDKLVGGTVAFNQLCHSYDDNSSTLVENPDGTLTVTSDGSTYYFGISVKKANNLALTTIVEHKYFVYTKLLSSNVSDYKAFILGNWQDGSAQITQTTGEFAKIVKSKNNTSGTYFNVSANSTTLNTDTFTCTKPIIIDLTAMFGSTIADYIYSLEQATAGAGVAWFKALFPNDYYAYNTGELMSVKATAHIMKNASNTVIGNYALDSNLELRGIPKLDENNNLYYDGDTYESSGAVGRNYGIVDLGTLNWGLQHHQTLGDYFCSDIPSDMIMREGAFGPTIHSILCYKYKTTGRLENVFKDKCICVDGTLEAVTRLEIKDSAYSDATAFKSSLSGVYLVYKKATPTTEQASPFTNPQVCDENGTEEYVDSRAVAIPVGHETYQANICEITGFDELNIGQSGINLWDEEWERGTYDNTNGSKISWSGAIRSKNKISITPNTTFYTPYNARLRLCFYLNGTFVSSQYITSEGPWAFTTPSGVNQMTFGTWNDYGSAYDPINKPISINYPATDTTYHAYTGNTYTIAFGQTVYGGVLDVTRGKLHVTWGGKDMGKLTWVRNTQYNNPIFLANIPEAKAVFVSVEMANSKCEILTLTTAQNCNDVSYDDCYSIMIYFNSSYNINVVAKAYNDIPSFISAVTGKMLIYELATPFDIDLTPQQVEALLGVNNVWHDANGGTEVKFFRMISAS